MDIKEMLDKAKRENLPWAEVMRCPVCNEILQGPVVIFCAKCQKENSANRKNGDRVDFHGNEYSVVGRPSNS